MDIDFKSTITCLMQDAKLHADDYTEYMHNYPDEYEPGEIERNEAGFKDLQKHGQALARSYLVIFHGEDGAPDPRCVEADTPHEAVIAAWRQCLDPEEHESDEDDYASASEWLHGVYPGFIGYRIDLEG